MASEFMEQEVDFLYDWRLQLGLSYGDNSWFNLLQNQFNSLIFKADISRIDIVEGLRTLWYFGNWISIWSSIEQWSRGCT